MVAIDGIGMTSRRTRLRLIQRLREAGIRDERVLGVMEEIPWPIVPTRTPRCP